MTSWAMALILLGLFLLTIWVVLKIIQVTKKNPVQVVTIEPIPAQASAQPAQNQTPQTPQPEQHVAETQETPTVHRIQTITPDAVVNGITRIIQVRLDADDPEIQQILNNFENTTEEVVERQDDETFQEFANRNQNHNDDSENVHNSQVVRELKARYEKLISLNGNLKYPPPSLQDVITEQEWMVSFKQQTFTQIANMISSQLTYEDSERDIKIQKIEAVIDKIKKGSTIMSLSPDHNDEDTFVKEDWLLMNVWWRIQHADNLNNKEKLETSLMDQLVDCGKVVTTENPLVAALQNLGGERVVTGEPRVSLVCVQGRASRLLQTFTFLDADPLLANPIMDDAEIRNAAFSETYRILQSELDSYKPDMRDLYDTIDDDSLSPKDIVELERFKNHVKGQVRIQLVSKFGDLVKPDELDKIIVDACSGV